MGDFQVPGFEAVELLGFGSGGEVWLARDHADGRPVALKRLRVGADLAARDRLRREAAVLAGVDHPHVVRLRSVVGAGDDLVLVLDLAAGGSLARLLASRRTLTPGEVVTLAVPLAQALADIHARGLVHGDVTPANVLFTADGRPMLSDLGVASLLGADAGETSGTAGFVDPVVAAGGSPGPAADVHGLAATCVAALTGQAPYDRLGARVPAAGGDRLGEVLEAALDPDPAARPGAAELARLVWACASAEPVRLTAGDGAAGSGPDPVPVTHRVDAGPRRAPDDGAPASQGPARRRRPSAPRWRTTAAALFGVTALAMAVVTGIAWAGAGGTSRPGAVAQRVASPSASAAVSARAADPGPVSASGPSSHWASALAALDAARSRAFGRADASALAQVYAEGSPALVRDRAALSRLSRAGLRAAGLRLDSRRVTELARAGASARLLVVDVMPPYRLVDAAGVVVDRRPGRGPTRWTVTLRRGDAGWRVYDVERG